MSLGYIDLTNDEPILSPRKKRTRPQILTTEEKGIQNLLQKGMGHYWKSEVLMYSRTGKLLLVLCGPGVVRTADALYNSVQGASEESDRSVHCMPCVQ